MRLERLSVIDGEAILPLHECKQHLRILHDDEDLLIKQMRDTAIAYVEEVSGVALAPATFRWSIPNFTAQVSLPMRPVTEVTDITYTDSIGAAATYTGRLVNGAVLPAFGDTWPFGATGTAFTFEAGPANPGDLEKLKGAVAIKLSLLMDRGKSDDRTLSGMQMALDALLKNWVLA